MTKPGNNAGNGHEKENFASRWSRRKQRVKLEQADTDANAEDINIAQANAAAPDTESSDLEQIRAEKLARLNALKDEDMPDIATLNENSDFSQFMSTNVSEELRKLALRKLFQGKTYNVRDGLDEYDGDYTSFEKLDPNTITADMRHRLELEAEKLKAQQEKERLEQTRALSDDDSAKQQELDESPDEAAPIEEDDEVISNEEPQDSDTPAEVPTEIQQTEREQSSARTTTEITGENKT
jgi:hypothetical protein